MDLDERILSAGLLERIQQDSDVRALIVGMKTLQSVHSALDNPEGWARLRTGLSRHGVDGIRWMQRTADRLPVPELRYGHLKPLTSAKQFEEVAISFQNCIRSKLGSAAAGRRAYVLVPETDTDPAVIAELEPLSDSSWILRHIEAPKGKALSDERRSRIRAQLCDAGVLLPMDRLDPDMVDVFGLWNLDA